jgi:hypothetical protein|nr:hypothetical protein [Kofleriaceae bacterium]
MIRATAATLLLLVGAADAEPDLTLHHTPVRHLTMRRKPPVTAAVAAMPPAARTAPPPPSLAPPPDPSHELAGPREPGQRVGAQIDIGYTIDGTQVAENPVTLGGHTTQLGIDVAQIRAYGFADAYVSTHGVGYTPLSTYLSARYELTDRLVGLDPRSGGATTAPLAPPIASWFDHSNLMIRSGWAELGDVLPADWGMPVSVRLGQQYVYGPWVMHMQGAVAAWTGKVLHATAYAGRRAPDYTYALLDSTQPAISGASLKIDLRDTPAAVPIVIGGDYMRMGFDDGTASTSYQGELDWRPRRDVVVAGSLRALDGELAHERVQLRGRYGQVTNYVVDIQGRQAADWQWDPSLVGPPSDATEARRYLDLGPTQPQLLASVRAGTVLFDNIDVLARYAFAHDYVSDVAQHTSTNASYREVAGALEVRVRRTIAVGVSVLRRDVDHPDVSALQITDTAGPQPLPGELLTGYDDFTEVGAIAKMSLGARRLSASVEVYGRTTNYQPLYVSQTMTAVPTDDLRGGGRVTVDAYISSKLRLFASYDLSSSIDLAPEITGYKSLRLVMEGVY